MSLINIIWQNMTSDYILYSLLHLTHLTFTPSESRRSNFFEPQFVQIGHARTGFTDCIFDKLHLKLIDFPVAYYSYCSGFRFYDNTNIIFLVDNWFFQR